MALSLAFFKSIPSRFRTISWVMILAVFIILSVNCSDGDALPNQLTDLSVSGSKNTMYPPFAPDTEHYALVHDPTDLLRITASSITVDTRITINNSEPAEGKAEVVLSDLMEGEEVVIDLTRGTQTQRYVIHYLQQDFPEIRILKKEDGVSDGLIYAAPKFQENGERKSYLLTMDNNGVPRFYRKLDGRVNDFKRHFNGLHSYIVTKNTNEFGLLDSEVVLLDEHFTELKRLKTVGLNQTDNHDFVITEDDTYLFISYNSTTRDMTAFGLSDQEVVGDSVIQEVTQSGEVIFQWNSWNHIDLTDCVSTGYPRFPSDYAHLNSISLTRDGDIIASFRGCGQIMKINRPTGNVVWQLGGSSSNFAIVEDQFSEFCGQHTASELPNGNILMFDNGGFCLGNREELYGQFSRILEYRLDSSRGEAVFTRDFSLNGSYLEFTRSQGSVYPLENGNLLISWGRGPDISITEITSSGREVFAVKILFGEEIAVTYRAFRYPD